MKDIRKIFGQNVKKARLMRHWSQEDLAEIAGLDRTYISGIERGIRNPTLTVVAQFSKALGIPSSDLLADEDTD